MGKYWIFYFIISENYNNSYNYEDVEIFDSGYNY